MPDDIKTTGTWGVKITTSLIFLFLGKLLNRLPYNQTEKLIPHDGFELVGIKWLPSLSTQHAKELTPYEVGDREWKTSIHTLTSGMSHPNRTRD